MERIRTPTNTPQVLARQTRLLAHDVSTKHKDLPPLFNCYFFINSVSSLLVIVMNLTQIKLFP